MDGVLKRRRAAVIAVTLALVAGACSHNTHETATVGGTVPGAGGTTSSSAARSASGGASPTTTRFGGSVTPHNPSNGTGRPHAGTNTTSVSEAAQRSPGEFAGVLLAPSAATSIVIDVLVQPGVSADANVLSTLRQIFAAASGKPVTLRGPAALNSGANVYSDSDIRRLADTQGKPQGDDVAVVHLLYLKGQFTDGSVLGVTVRGDTTAIFPDQITQSSSVVVSRQRLEQAVDTHEMGHVLGLVDLFLNDNRDDPQHPGHSTNPQSVMYWAVETDLVSQVLNGPPPVDFDAADQADLQKIHAGAPEAAH